MTHKVPKEIRANLESAQSLLDDACSMPGASRHDATRYFLYIKAWELWHTANAKFEAWAQSEQLDPKVLRDHGLKLDDSPEVGYMEMNKSGKLKIQVHVTGNEKSKLLQQLIFGEGAKSRIELFETGWDFDSFHNRLIDNMKWLQVTIEIVEKEEL